MVGRLLFTAVFFLLLICTFVCAVQTCLECTLETKKSLEQPLTKHCFIFGISFRRQESDRNWYNNRAFEFEGLILLDAYFFACIG